MTLYFFSRLYTGALSAVSASDVPQISTGRTICAAVELAGLIAAVALFFVALRTAVRDLGYIDKDNPDNEDKRMNKALSKSMILIGAGMAAYMISRSGANYYPMRAEGFGIFGTLIQSLWEAIWRTGFLLVVPYIIKQWRKTARINAFKK